MPGERLEQATRDPAALRAHPAAGMWPRYRPALLAALPSGAVAGALTAVGVQLDGLGEGADATSTVVTALLCAVVGVLLSGVAALGAVVAVLLRRHRLRAQGAVGYGTIAAGSGVAVGGATLLVLLAVESGDPGRLPIVVLVALAAAAVGAIAAVVVTALSLRWRRALR